MPSAVGHREQAKPGTVDPGLRRPERALRIVAFVPSCPMLRKIRFLLEFLHKFKRRQRESMLARRFRNRMVLAIGFVRPLQFGAEQ